MNLTWLDVAQPAVAGLGGILGVYAVEDLLAMLRRRGVTWTGWRR